MTSSKHVLPIILFCIFMTFVSCKQRTDSGAPPPSELGNRKKEYAGPKKSLLWDYFCSMAEFKEFGGCIREADTCENYTVHLGRGVSAMDVLISLNFNNDSVLINYFAYRISLSYDTKFVKKYQRLDSLPVPNRNEKVYVYYNMPSQVRSSRLSESKRQQIMHFFQDYIWTIPEETKSNLLDGEYWTVIARKNTVKKRVVRSDFADKEYYSQLQELLNICGIKNYRYLPPN